MRKAMTPIMATLLLLSFAVTIGILVMNFARAQVVLEAECTQNIELAWMQFDGRDDVCYDVATDEILFTVENGVQIEVQRLQATAVGRKAAQSYEIPDSKIIRAGSFVGQVDYVEFDNGALRQFKVIPVIESAGQEHFCTEQALTITSVPEC